MYLSSFFWMKIVTFATQNFLLARSLPLTYVSTSYTVLCGKSQAYEVKAKAVSTLFNNFLLCGVRPAYYKYTLYYTLYFTMYTVHCTVYSVWAARRQISIGASAFWAFCQSLTKWKDSFKLGWVWEGGVEPFNNWQSPATPFDLLNCTAVRIIRSWLEALG